MSSCSRMCSTAFITELHLYTYRWSVMYIIDASNGCWTRAVVTRLSVNFWPPFVVCIARARSTRHSFFNWIECTHITRNTHMWSPALVWLLTCQLKLIPLDRLSSRSRIRKLLNTFLDLFLGTWYYFWNIFLNWWY